jgi:hypothetical protein
MMRHGLIATGILVAMFAATACTNEGSETDSPSSTGSEVIEAPTADESTETTNEPAFDPNDAMTFFDTLTIPGIGREWEVISPADQADYFVQLVNYAACSETIVNKCPRLTFERLDAIPPERQSGINTTDDPAFELLSWQCQVDASTLEGIIQEDEILIGGMNARHLSLLECPAEPYQEEFTWYTKYAWYVDGILISAEESVGGTLDMQALEAAFLQAEWL